MRPTELVPQFAQPRRATGAQQLRFGLALMTLGLFNKVVLADSFLSPVAERVYDSDKIPGALDAWVATLAFSGQIFCDFAGYSTTAIGAALCLGFAMPDNFRFPVCGGGILGFLAALAHHAVILAARLPLHSARRQPSRRAAARTSR